MEINLQEQYEKVLLIVFGLIALVVSGLLVFKSMGGEKVDGGSSAGDDKGKARAAKPQLVTNAIQLLKKGSTWETPVRDEKPNPFAASNPILSFKGIIFDMMDPASEPLWAPVDNDWWYKNKLDPINPDCRDEDPDGDSFTNVNEFLHKTDPNDEASAPDWPTAVEMVERVELEYQFRIFYIGPEVQFSRILPTRRVWFLNPGTTKDTTDDKRFRVTSVISAGPDSFAQPAQIVLQDAFRTEGSPLKVADRETVDRPEFQAKLRFNISKEEIVAKKGAPFNFTGLAYELTITKIAENFVEITYTDDKGRKQKLEARIKN
jgi:hypothetical protein